MVINKNSVMGILVLNGTKDTLKELSLHRPVAAAPFGARYRVIDFALSNIVNAGIRNVGVYVKEKYRSLMDHLGIGKEWDLNRQRDGLFILPPGESQRESGSFSNGDLPLLREHLDYLVRSTQEYAVIFSGPEVMNIDLQPMFAFHLEKEADITLLYQNRELKNKSPYTEIVISRESEVTSIKIEPFLNTSTKILLDTFIIKRELLIELIDSAQSRGGLDFVRDVLIPNLNKLRILGFEFHGYARRIGSVECYFQTSLELLDPKVYQELFFAHGPIYTKVKNEPPVYYANEAKVRNSLIANGCRIEGTVENSILFRGVKVERGAVVKNSIIMQKSQVHSSAGLENVIVDKDCTISKKKTLKGDAMYPLLIGKGTTL